MTSPHHVLVEALKDVESADVPDDLRQLAFAKVFDLRASAAADVGAVGAPIAPAAIPGRIAAPGQGTSQGDALDQIAARLGLERVTVGEVFDTRDGKVELIIPAGKLPAKDATATKEIALVVAGGRQAAGLEEWTALDEIREVCADFKRLDSPNFAKTIREMENVFNFRKESERKLQVRLARPGWELATEAIRRLGEGLQ